MRQLTKRLGNSMAHLAFLSSLVLSSNCTPDFEGEYDDPAKKEIVDDRWNETDARETAKTMISSVLTKSWLDEYKRTHNKQKPIVIVDAVENRTDEHIDTKALTEFIRDELINSQKIRFVNEERRDKILSEIKYQQESGHVSQTTAKKKGQALGADYLLGGAVSSNVHSQGGLKTVTYQTNLTLTNLETQEIEWSDKLPIKKRFNRSGAGW